MDRRAVLIRKLEIQVNSRFFRLDGARLIPAIAALVLVGACSRAVPPAVASEPTAETVCALDGMVLNDFPGPKAQIHYAEGAPDFFCDLIELFAAVLAPEQKRAVTGLFVQDMGKAEWDHPSGNWIDAKKAVYVVGSRKQGSMGTTFGSFAGFADAETFAKREGGKVLRFDQITTGMLARGSAAH
jgi:copper chaperone NosL